MSQPFPVALPESRLNYRVNLTLAKALMDWQTACEKWQSSPWLWPESISFNARDAFIAALNGTDEYIMLLRADIEGDGIRLARGGDYHCQHISAEADPSHPTFVRLKVSLIGEVRPAVTLRLKAADIHSFYKLND